MCQCFGVIGPRVTGTEQLAGKDPAGGKRPADARPQGRELPGRTERQAEPGMDQVRGRQVRRRERRAQNVDPSGRSGRDARPEQREPGWLGVDRQDQPAAGQQLQRIGAFAAAQVDRQAVLAGPELLACGEQQRPRLTAGRRCVVSGPVRAAVIGHSAIMPARAMRDNRCAVPDPAAAGGGLAAIS